MGQTPSGVAARGHDDGSTAGVLLLLASPERDGAVVKTEHSPLVRSAKVNGSRS